MANGNEGLLEQFGLSNVTEEELSLARNRQRAEAALAQATVGSQGRSQATQIASRIGSLIGQKGGQFLSKDDLVSDRESARIGAVQAAQTRMTEAQARNPALAGLEGEAKQNVFQQILADELAQRGEVQLGLEVGADLQNKRRTQQSRDLELDKLGISRDRAEIALEADQGSIARDRRGEVTTVFPKGSSDPNSGQTAFIQNDGTAITPDGKRVPLGEFTIVRPVAPRADGKPLTANDLGVSDKEQRSIRDQASATMSMARGAIQMADAISEVASPETGVNIMDGTGRITSGVDKALNILGGVSRQIGATIDVLGENNQSRGNLSTGAGADKYVTEDFDEIDERLRDLVPENIRDDARARAKYYSALTRITYANARAQEPGARQLSDADFKNSLAVMAGNASDPEAFRQVMVNNMQENVDSFSDRRAMIGDEVFGLIIKPKGLKRFDDTMSTFNDRFGVDFGTAETPGPGLIPPQVEAPLPEGTERVGGATVKFK